MLETFTERSHMIEPQRIADILLASPVWARLGLAAPDCRCRERAADAIATIVADRLERPPHHCDERQLPLSL
jgi:hypothetical protein